MKRFLVIIFTLFSYAAFSQIGGAGVCHVTANPNTVTDLIAQDSRSECLVAIDTTTGNIYFYNSTLTAGSRWVNLTFVTDTDTRLANPRVANDSLKFNIINVITSTVLDSISIPVAAIAPVRGISAGTGINVTSSSGVFTITNASPDQTVSITGTGITVGGTYPNFTLTAADQSATNEIQVIDTFAVVGNQIRLSLSLDNEAFKTVTLPPTDLTFTGSASPFTLNSSTGTNVTIASGVGIELVRSTNQLTIQYKEVAAKNHVDAGALGVAVGDYFYTTPNNTMGMPPGVKVRRAY
jgi:hypothetical protein